MKELGELRAAAAGLSPERVLGAIDRALCEWRDSRSEARVRLRETHPVFSGPVLDLGCERALASWTRGALAALRSRELPACYRSPELTAVWLAGCIPTASFAALIPPLLVGSSVYAKPDSQDPVSPALFRDSLLRADEDVGRAIAVGSDAEVLAEADAVIVHGRDDTVAELRSRVPVGRIFVGHGHRVSLAAVARHVEAEDAARAVGLDLALYDGRGCLSPAWILAEDRPAGRAAALARALAEELDRLSRSLPRGKADAGEEAWVHDLRARAAVREDAQLFAPGSSTAWTVVLEPLGAHPDPGMLRSLPVVPVSDLDALAEWCIGLAPHLSSLGHAGWGERAPRPEEVVVRAGGSRVCALGQMQCPPIGWHHDGIATVGSLIRHVDVEPEEEGG